MLSPVSLPSGAPFEHTLKPLGKRLMALSEEQTTGVEGAKVAMTVVGNYRQGVVKTRDKLLEIHLHHRGNLRYVDLNPQKTRLAP